MVNKERKLPRGTRIEIDEQGRTIIILPQVGRPSLSIDNKRLHGTELTSGQRYIRTKGDPT